MSIPLIETFEKGNQMDKIFYFTESLRTEDASGGVVKDMFSPENTKEWDIPVSRLSSRFLAEFGNVLVPELKDIREEICIGHLNSAVRGILNGWPVYLEKRYGELYDELKSQRFIKLEHALSLIKNGLLSRKNGKYSSVEFWIEGHPEWLMVARHSSFGACKRYMSLHAYRIDKDSLLSPGYAAIAAPSFM